MDSPDAADQPGEPLGAILARWRKRRKLTGQALGDLVGMSQAKISRLETGAVAAEPGDVRLLAQALELPPTEADRVVELAEHADNQLTDWTPAGRAFGDSQRQYGRMEAVAKELRVFQPTVIPGLMQTSEYARAIMSTAREAVNGAGLADSAIAVSDGVNARMKRNEVLDLADHQFHFLITEQVLRNRVCEPAEMIAQIHRITALAAYPNVDLRIVTDDAVLPIAPYHGFVVADDRWVSVDLFNASVMSRGRKTVHAYRSVFDALEAVSRSDVGELLVHYEDHYARMLLPNVAAS